MSLRKDLGKIVKSLRAQGWVVKRRKGGHYKLISPEGAPVFTGTSPSDRRALDNLRATLRKKGADV